MIGTITATCSYRMRVVDRPAWRDFQAWLDEQTLITARSTYRLDLLSEDGRDYRAHVFRMSAGRFLGRDGQLERDVVETRSVIPLPVSVRRHLEPLPAEGTPTT